MAGLSLAEFSSPLGVQAQPEARLRFAVNQSWAPPLVEHRGGRVVGGLMPDLMRAIAAEMGLQPEFLLLPPTRMGWALEQGGVDLHCLLATSWWPEMHDRSRWSVPLLRLRDVLVAGPSGPDLSDLDAGSGPWVVSTVLNYRYPALAPSFASGRFRRDDALDQWAALGKLARGHTPLAVVNEYVLQGYQRRLGPSGLHVLKVVDDLEGHCVLSARPSVPAANIQAAIRRVAGSAQLADLLRRYAPAPTASAQRQEAPR